MSFSTFKVKIEKKILAFVWFWSIFLPKFTGPVWRSVGWWRADFTHFRRCVAKNWAAYEHMERIWNALQSNHNNSLGTYTSSFYPWQKIVLLCIHLSTYAGTCGTYFNLWLRIWVCKLTNTFFTIRLQRIAFIAITIIAFQGILTKLVTHWFTSF